MWEVTFAMEPQETIYCYDNKEQKCTKKRNCFGIVAIILLTAFAVVIGLLIGAAISAAILANLAIIDISSYINVLL